MTMNNTLTIAPKIMRQLLTPASQLTRRALDVTQNALIKTGFRVYRFSQYECPIDGCRRVIKVGDGYEYAKCNRRLTDFVAVENGGGR
jgi:hypothetical protein